MYYIIEAINKGIIGIIKKATICRAYGAKSMKDIREELLKISIPIPINVRVVYGEYRITLYDPNTIKHYIH